MKRNEVKPGVRAMLSLGGRRGAVAVTVVEVYSRCSVTDRRPTWRALDSSGRDYEVTARQLRPIPAPTYCGHSPRPGHAACDACEQRYTFTAEPDMRRCACGRAASGIDDCPMILCDGPRKAVDPLDSVGAPHPMAGVRCGALTADADGIWRR